MRSNGGAAGVDRQSIEAYEKEAEKNLVEPVCVRSRTGRLEKILREGMKTKMLLMAGNPGEDDHTVNDTIRMIEMVIIIFSVKPNETTAYFLSVYEFQNPHINA